MKSRAKDHSLRRHFPRGDCRSHTGRYSGQGALESTLPLVHVADNRAGTLRIMLRHPRGTRRLQPPTRTTNLVVLAISHPSKLVVSGGSTQEYGGYLVVLTHELAQKSTP